MTNYKSNLIARAELFEGDVYGTHFVLEDPIVGFKKVVHLIPIKEYEWQGAQTFKSVYCVAKVEIPVGAIIIRPLADGNVCTKLRTNIYKIIDITQIDQNYLDKACLSGYSFKETSNKKIYEAKSTYDLNYNYTIGETYSVDLHLDEHKHCTSGLHFFLDEKMAENF